MKLNFSIAGLVLGSLVVGGQALADCPGPFVTDAKQAYEQAQAYEKQGKQEQALRAYERAEGYVCENVNPYEANAAKRAAPLGLALGGAAEKKGDWRLAFELYDAGGHFAQADRAFMAFTRAKADNPDAYQAAREHFDTRGLESFASNHSAALKVTGAYRPDAKLIAEVSAMPAKGFERASQKESAAFNEQYLSDYVRLIQARADDLTDPAAIQRTISAQQVFVQKWQQQEPIKATLEALRTMRAWGSVSGDERLARQAETQVRERADQHAKVLAQKYSAAPKMLEEAIGFVRMQGLETAQSDARIGSLRAQALKLADEAGAKKRYLLAAEYYDVAGESAKSQAMRDRQGQVAMQKMQPSIDEAKRQAEELQKQFSDPEKVKAMREQAEAARQSIQKEQASSKQANRKSAEDLEKELGL